MSSLKLQSKRKDILVDQIMSQILNQLAYAHYHLTLLTELAYSDQTKTKPLNTEQ